MRITESRDGTVRIELIGERGREWEPDEIPALPEYLDDNENGYHCTSRPVQVGDAGCLVTHHDVSPDAQRLRGPTEYSAHVVNSPEGIPGNSNHAITRLHGWRGTSYDSYCDAWGWRRVESIEPRKRGVGWVVILSADLRPDED